MKIEFLDTRKKCLVLGMTVLISFFLVGSSLLSGLLFVACMSRYDTGRKEASLPFIVCHAVRNISSPFVGYLGKKFGLVIVTGIGCLLATIGIGACFFAENIVGVIFFWGIIYGLGFGMGTGLLPQILRQHFEEHIDKANGLTLGGGSIGSFILPIIVDRLIVEYGTSGMFLIISAIVLNSVPAALLLKKLDNTGLKCKNTNGLLQGIISGNHEISKCIKKDHMHDRKTITNLEQKIEISGSPNRMSSESLKISELQNAPIFPNNILEENDKIKIPYNEESKNARALTKEAEIQFENIKTVTKNRNINLPVTLLNVQSESNLKENSELSNRSLCSKYLKWRSSSTPNKECASFNSFLVFLDVTYILILLTQGFMQIVLTTVWTIIVDASKDKGIAESDGVYVMICIGVTVTFGLFCLGYVTDGGYMTKINFQILCIVGFGICTILFILLEGFLMFMISSAFIGLFTAGLLMICVGIINQYIEKEFMTMAIASKYFAFSLMSFSQAPMIGFFREDLKSYDGLFLLLAGICAICIVLTWLTPIAARRRDEKKLLS
ncbi:uncharacterized protein TNCT_533021 [Trichonephila clavata]|uniref:Uncharacterized protein n=1 Tax=Trichonephila clavata TaxID=2740835 RepID=A0A8X6J1R3_TRICU|nr:uncharacterized protein TNCT_533021 [Trichonephila clavata]